MKSPVLYSLARCPYAIRARMALLYAEQDVLLRAISMKEKPIDMLNISPKGTVPVLLLPNGQVIDESLDIMMWALTKNDPNSILGPDMNLMMEIINHFEDGFRPIINAYKEARRGKLDSSEGFRDQGEVFIQVIEDKLKSHNYLFGDHICLADITIFPFIRQYANVEKKWFKSTGHIQVAAWLERIIEGDIFKRTMRKAPLWLEQKEDILFSYNN